MAEPLVHTHKGVRYTCAGDGLLKDGHAYDAHSEKFIPSRNGAASQPVEKKLVAWWKAQCAFRGLNQTGAINDLQLRLREAKATMLPELKTAQTELNRQYKKNNKTTESWAKLKTVEQKAKADPERFLAEAFPRGATGRPANLDLVVVKLQDHPALADAAESLGLERVSVDAPWISGKKPSPDRWLIIGRHRDAVWNQMQEIQRETLRSKQTSPAKPRMPRQAEEPTPPPKKKQAVKKLGTASSQVAQGSRPSSSTPADRPSVSRTTTKIKAEHTTKKSTPKPKANPSTKSSASKVKVEKSVPPAKVVDKKLVATPSQFSSSTSASKSKIQSTPKPPSKQTAKVEEDKLPPLIGRTPKPASYPKVEAKLTPSKIRAPQPAMRALPLSEGGASFEDEPIVSQNDFEFSGLYKISCPYIEGEWSTNDNLYLNIIYSENGRKRQMFAEFHFGIIEGFIRFEKSAKAVKSEPTVVKTEVKSEPGSSHKRKREQDSDDEESEDEDAKYQPSIFNLTATDIPTLRRSTWRYRWRGREEGNSQIVLKSDRKVETITFEKGGKLSGTFNCCFTGRVPFTGVQMKTYNTVDKSGPSDIEQSWNCLNENAWEFENVSRWGGGGIYGGRGYGADSDIDSENGYEDHSDYSY